LRADFCDTAFQLAAPEPSIDGLPVGFAVHPARGAELKLVDLDHQHDVLLSHPQARPKCRIMLDKINYRA